MQKNLQGPSEGLLCVQGSAPPFQHSGELRAMCQPRTQLSPSLQAQSWPAGAEEALGLHCACLNLAQGCVSSPYPRRSFLSLCFSTQSLITRSARAGSGEEGELGVRRRRRRRARAQEAVWLSPPPGLPPPSFLLCSPSFLPSSPLRRPRPVYLLPPHVTRQRAMQITAAAGSHWPRRAHLMAARARRMAAGPRAPPAPRAPPLRAHGPGQAAGSPSRARRPRLSGPLHEPALLLLSPGPSLAAP